MIPPSLRGPGRGQPSKKRANSSHRLTAAGLAGIFLLAISPDVTFAAENDPAGPASAPAPASRPQFRNSQPAPVLDEGTHRSIGGGFTGTEGLTNIPPGAFETDRFGVRQSTLFRNTTFPYGNIFTPPAVGPELHGEDINASFKLTLPAISGGLPWTQRAFEPQDADLKIGPFYFKLRAIEAAVLTSDNINLTPDDRETGTIAMVSATMDLVAQVTESLRIATSATFVYLPTEGKAGFVGFGLSDIYNFGLAAGPLARAQVSWDTDIGGWHVVLSDDFQVIQGYYSNEFRSDDVLFEGARFNDESRAGRYAFRPNEGAVFDDAGHRDNRVDLREDLVAFSNAISVDAERVSPGSILLKARAYHEDLWYNQGNRGQPSLRDGGEIGIYSQRENMRFKPYFIYDIYHTDEADDLQHIFRGGITGPITEQIFLFAEAGYYTGGLAGSGGLWHVQLNHTIGPYTRQTLSYQRSFNYFHDEVDTVLGYTFNQILGPTLYFDTYVYRVRAEDYYSDHNNDTTRDEWHLGARLTFTPGPKTTFRLTGQYAEGDVDNTKAWTGRLELAYNFTDTLLLHAAYQYQKSTSDSFGLNYTENLFFLSLTKYFE